MKHKRLNEIRLNPDTGTYAYNSSTRGVKGASSMFSSISNTESLENYDTDNYNENETLEEMDDEMTDEDILQLRKKINGRYALLETLDNVENNLMNEFVGEFVGDTVGALKAAGANIGKSTVGAIPIVDALVGTYRLASLASAINEFSDEIAKVFEPSPEMQEKFANSVLVVKDANQQPKQSNVVRLKNGKSYPKEVVDNWLNGKFKEPKYFGDTLKEESEDSYEEFIAITDFVISIDQKGEDEESEIQEKLLTNFNEVLERIKELIITIVESYDTIAAAVMALVGTPIASVAAGGGVNVGTFIGALSARAIPFERFLFSGGTFMISGLKTILELLFGESKEKSELSPKLDSALSSAGSDDPDNEKARKRINNAKNSLNKANKANSIVSALLFSPIDTLDKLGRYYKLLTGSEKYKSFAQKGLDFAAETLSEAKHMSLIDLVDLNAMNESLQIQNFDEEFEEINLEELSDLDEFSTSGGSLGGRPSYKLGDSPKRNPDGRHVRLFEKEKAINEQRERIRILQAYHQKTTNKLK